MIIQAGKEGDMGELKFYRKRLRLTQMALAKAVGYSEGFISKLESGRIKPRKDQACEISLVLSVPPDRVFPELFKAEGIVQKGEKK